MAVGAYATPVYYMEAKRQQAQEKATRHRIPEDAGSFRPYVQARQRVDAGSGTKGSGSDLGRAAKAL